MEQIRQAVIFVGSVLLGFLLFVGVQSIARTDDMGILSGVLVVSMGTALVFQMRAFLKAARTRDNSKDNIIQDVSHEGRLIPMPAEHIVNELVGLGFQRLGESSTDVPGTKDGTTWYYINQQKTIFVEVVHFGATMLQFTTVLADQTVLETSFPVGENITKPNFYSQENTDSLRATYKTHITKAKELIGKHGKPIFMRSMNEVLTWDYTYRQLYPYKLQSLVSRQRMRLVDWSIVLVVLTLMAWIG